MSTEQQEMAADCTGSAQGLRFYLVFVSRHGYAVREVLNVGSLAEAAARHAERAIKEVRRGYALVMRSASGRRYSASESYKLCKEQQ